MNATHLRRIIDAAVADLGYKTKHCKESVLIREGYFVGRRFCYEGIKAVWFAEEAVVKLQGDDGQVLGSLTVAEVPTMRKRAA